VARNSNFLRAVYEFPTEETTSAQYINFTPKWVICSRKFCSLRKKIRQTE